MGLWDTLKAAAWEANEKSRSERLSPETLVAVERISLLVAPFSIGADGFAQRRCVAIPHLIGAC